MSSALENLVSTRLTEVSALDSVRPPGTSSAVFRQQQAINRASVVLISAHLEGFIEDLIGECIDALNAARPETDRLPRVLLASHVEEELRAVAEITDLERFSQRTERLFTDFGDLWLADNLVGGLTADALSRHVANPGSKVIVGVFRRLGIDSVLDGIALPDGSAIHARVNELVGVRNAIAHGANVSVTDEQVRRYLETVEHLGRELDVAAAALIQKVTQSAVLPWA